ncbi:hypothetical protein BASA81_011575 [Batrachochytrium salamandrivorans]|nr:hypothetical protein BASA81_011575 [Batrachochytrium salamandrivorans]
MQLLIAVVLSLLATAVTAKNTFDLPSPLDKMPETPSSSLVHAPKVLDRVTEDDDDIDYDYRGEHIDGLDDDLEGWSDDPMRELDVSDLFEHLDEDGNPKVPAPEQITSTPPLPLNGHTTNSVDLCSTEPESSTELLDSIHTVPVSCANDDVWGFKDTSLPKHNVFLSPRPDQPEQSTSSTVAHGNTPPVSSSQLIAPLDKIHKDPHESLNNNPIPTDTTYPHDPTKRSKHSTPPPWGKSQISPPMDHMSRQGNTLILSENPSWSTTN